MLEVYDRVLPGRSVPTLVAISILALVMFSFQGVLDIVRGRVLVRIARSVDQTLSRRVFDLAEEGLHCGLINRNDLVGYQPMGSGMDLRGGI